MMRKRDVIGRKIVAIKRHRVRRPNHGRSAVHITSLTLDDGTIITFEVLECEDGYAIEGTVHPPPRRP